MQNFKSTLGHVDHPRSSLQVLVSTPLQHGSERNVGTQQGFTILEVFVALMVSITSLTVALQIFMATAYLRVRAEQFGDIHNWVQEDYERVKAKADTFESQALPHSQYCGAVPTNNLAANFIADNASGLGGNSTILGPRDIAGGSFKLTRTASYATSIAPDRLVSLNYSLTPAAGGNAVFEIDAEVAIYAAFKCPA